MLCLLTFVLTLSTARFLYAEVIDKIAIVVNNEIITQSEIDRLMAPVYAKYRTVYQGDELIDKLEEVRQRIVEQLIDDRLILGEAKKLNIEVDDREVEEKIEEMKKQFGSKEALDSMLSEQRMTLKDLRTHYREQIMSRRLVDQKIGSKIVITPIDISDFYNAHAKEFVQPEEVKLRNILIRPKQDSDVQRAANQAKEILRRLKEGCDFGELAKVYSEGPGAKEGGLMGYVKKGDLLPEIENVVFNVKEGETSDIVQTSVGYHIFKVEERRESRSLTLSEVRRDIEDMIFREKIRGKLKGWVEGLKKNAYIAFK